MEEIAYGETCTGRPGRGAGQPLRRPEADGPRGRPRAEHYRLLPVRRAPGRLRTGDLRDHQGTGGGFPGDGGRPGQPGHGGALRLPGHGGPAQGVPRALRAAEALGNHPRGAGRPRAHRRALRRHQRRRLLRARGLPGDLRLPVPPPGPARLLPVRHGGLPPAQHRHRARQRGPGGVPPQPRRAAGGDRGAHQDREGRGRRPLHRGRGPDLGAPAGRYAGVHELLGLPAQLPPGGPGALPGVPGPDSGREPRQRGVLSAPAGGRHAPPGQGPGAGALQRGPVVWRHLPGGQALCGPGPAGEDRGGAVPRGSVGVRRGVVWPDCTLHDGLRGWGRFDAAPPRSAFLGYGA